MYSDVVSANAAAIEVDRLQLMLNTKLKSTNAFSDLKLGHEEAIRIIDAVSFESACAAQSRAAASASWAGHGGSDALSDIRVVELVQVPNLEPRILIAKRFGSVLQITLFSHDSNGPFLIFKLPKKGPQTPYLGCVPHVALVQCSR